MSDQKLGLPVRSEADGTDGRVQVKVVDATTPAQQMEVDTDGNAHIEVHGNRADDAADQVLLLSELGYANTDGVYHADDNSDPANVGLVALSQNASPVDSQQTLRLTAIANGTGSTRSLDVAIRNSDGEPISESNPIAVFLAENPGIEVVDYLTSASVASDASVNHDYTVGGGVSLKVDRVFASASSRSKIEVQVEDGVGEGTFTSVAVAFGTSSDPNMLIEFGKVLEVAAGVILRVIRTNRDNQAQDLYSTIMGVES